MAEVPCPDAPGFVDALRAAGPGYVRTVIAGANQDELAERINDYVERSIARAIGGAEAPTQLEMIKTVLESPSSRERDAERSGTVKLASLAYPFLILAFGLVGLVWLIRLLFF